MVEFRMLGPLEVLRDGRPIELRGSRPRAVLTVLLLNADQHVSTDRLIDELWGAQPPDRARGIVHHAVSDIRRAVESSAGPVVLESQPSGYTLHASRAGYDLTEFEQLLAGASASLDAGRPEPAARSLERALAMWRGPPLAEFVYEP